MEAIVRMGTMVTVGIVAALIGAAVYAIIRRRRQGKSACGCDCGGCTGCKEKRRENR